MFHLYFSIGKET